MTGPDGPPARLSAAHGMGQLLLYGALGLVVTAAATLALAADDARLLRLGVLAALGAALLGGFAAVTMRRAASSGADRTKADRTEADRTEDLRTIYRLELERDIAARREHELTVERELRREAKEDSRDELEAVRAELRSLHENLQKLFGGELLVERVAVRAESTRVRSLPEEAPHLSPSRVRALEPAADLVVPPAGNDDAGPEESPPLPRRDPEARTDPTRRPRPEESRSVPRPDGFVEGSLFEKPPQRSSPSWTPSWPSAPRPWGPWAPADPQPCPAGDQWVAPAPPGPATTPAESVGDRAEPDPPTVPMVIARRHHRGEVPEEPTGAHSGGRSVDDLLAAYGADSGVRRRRRREDD